MSIQTLVDKIKEKGNPTVAGLDARAEYIPESILRRNFLLHGETLRAVAESMVAFNCGLIDALCDIVPAVKPQAAYYELLGSYGAMALKQTIDYAHAKGMYVIADIKRNDIGATATAYPYRRYRDCPLRLRLRDSQRLPGHGRCRAVPERMPQP